MYNYARFTKVIKDDLHRRAREAVNSPERKRQAVQRGLKNEDVYPEPPPKRRTEPDQHSPVHNTGKVSQKKHSDFHDYVKKYPADGSNIDDVEAGTEMGSERVARDYDDADNFDYHQDKFDPYTTHRRPADRDDNYDFGA